MCFGLKCCPRTSTGVNVDRRQFSRRKRAHAKFVFRPCEKARSGQGVYERFSCSPAVDLKIVAEQLSHAVNVRGQVFKPKQIFLKNACSVTRVSSAHFHNGSFAYDPGTERGRARSGKTLIDVLRNHVQRRAPCALRNGLNALVRVSA